MKKTLVQQNLVDKLLHQGISLHENGKLINAKEIFAKILVQWPDDFEALQSLGTIEAQLGNYENSCGILKRASAINPNHAATYFNLALALRCLKKLDDAIFNLQRAIELEPKNPDYYFEYSTVLIELRRYEDAANCFDKLLKFKNGTSRDHFYYAYCLSKLNLTEAAILSFDKCIELDTENEKAYFNRGCEFIKLNKPLEASASFGMALTIDPNYAAAYHNSGAALAEMKQMQAASASYLKALEIEPTLEFLMGTCLYQKLLMCDWDYLDEGIEYCTLGISDGQKIALPFPAISFLDEESLQLKNTKIFSEAKFPSTNDLGQKPRQPKHEKVRIGYFSADFYYHATSHLIAKLFLDHDRQKFEVYGFSFGPGPKDKTYQQVASSFDKFFDVSDKSDLDIVRLSREIGLDIAIDLKGYTKNNRTEIFAEGCAPIQVNFLGFPGTMGADYIDYIIADNVVIPSGKQEFYTEKIVRLPYCYQVNDSSRQISEKNFTKIELGLPESGFIFCCFNNNYKITPQVFDTWTRILKEVDGSVLWLLEDNDAASENLYKEAEKRGLNSTRLVFAKRMPTDLHLARHRLADLFIDTLPCNAHTTASDALWAGLPVLTMKGQSFAGRVAASLLSALDLPELITSSISEYESVAIDLAKNPNKLNAVRKKLELNKHSKPLFNTSLFAKHLEDAYIQMYERLLNGEAPSHICVKP
jgi:predicted O-linked N-acetylglucosamine transferase (SPINDLY family)